jgi:hypothetical protein
LAAENLKVRAGKMMVGIVNQLIAIVGLILDGDWLPVDAWIGLVTT